MNNFDYKNMTPFKWFVLENFPFIENDFDAINNYHLFSKVVEYLNKMKDNVNLTGEQMENVTNAMIELQNYVNNYFENLDVQEEVNNKLDEMTESGELAEIINQEIFNDLYENVNNNTNDIEILKEKIKYYMLPVNNFATDSSGDCSIFITPNNKIIMIDTGNISSYQKIKNSLIRLNITKIDYLIISHYHQDHVGNLGSLMNDFDFSSCVCFIPRYSDDTVAKPNYTFVHNLIANLEQIEPENLSSYNLDGIVFKFFNCSQEDEDYYMENSNYYNDHSMCCYAYFKNNKFLFVGDIQTKAQERIVENNWVEPCDVYKMEHHSVNSEVLTSYIQKIQAKIAVTSTNEQNVKESLLYPNAGSLAIRTTSYLTANGCKIFSTCYNENEIGFESDGNKINLITNSLPMQYHSHDVFTNIYDINTKNTQIYVDSNYANEFSDGSKEKPFKHIREAIVMAYNNNIPTQINIADGTYDEIVYISNTSSRISLVGESKENTKIKQIICSGCFLLGISTLNIYDNLVGALDIKHSNVDINDCLIDGNITSASSINEGRGVRIYHSNVYFSNCTISNKKASIWASDNSFVSVVSLSGNNNDYIYYLGTTAILEEANTQAQPNLAYLYLPNKNSLFQGDLTFGNTQHFSNLIGSSTAVSFPFWNTQTARPIWWNGSYWALADGTRVL